MASLPRYLNPYNVKQELEIVSRSEVFKDDEDEPELAISETFTEDLKALEAILRSSLIPQHRAEKSNTKKRKRGDEEESEGKIESQFCALFLHRPLP